MEYYLVFPCEQNSNNKTDDKKSEILYLYLYIIQVRKQFLNANNFLQYIPSIKYNIHILRNINMSNCTELCMVLAIADILNMLLHYLNVLHVST